MKLLASLAFGMATLLASSLGFAAPAMAHDDDVTLGVRVGPLCVGLCIDGGNDYRGGRHHRRSDAGYEDDFDGGFYAHREDYYHQRYDRRVAYDDAREDGYAGYRRNGHDRHGHDGNAHGRRHHDADDADDEDDEDDD